MIHLIVTDRDTHNNFGLIYILVIGKICSSLAYCALAQNAGLPKYDMMTKNILVTSWEMIQEKRPLCPSGLIERWQRWAMKATRHNYNNVHVPSPGIECWNKGGVPPIVSCPSRWKIFVHPDKGSHRVRKVQFFLTLFKRPLTPRPPPLLFEHHVVNFLKSFFEH